MEDKEAGPVAGFLVLTTYELLLLGGLLLGATLLLRGFLRGFLFHGHGTISSTGVEHPCDPPVDRRASDRAPRGYSADSLCARTARTNNLGRSFVVTAIRRLRTSFVTRGN